MGAILAIIGEAGDPELPERLEKMIARSPYRGTPERHFEGGLALAVQTRGWDASLATVGNWTVAVHGLIGNWSELAPIYGWRFPENASSAAKLAIAYENLGDSLFGTLRGEFAVLVHDRWHGRIKVLRDPWGRRPLFFEQERSRTFIATEIRQVRAGSMSPISIDRDVLVQDIVRNPAYPDRTIFQGVGRIRAGEVLQFRRSYGRRPEFVHQVWDPPRNQLDRYCFEELVEELTTLIERAVSRWLINIPFAVSLSGGVDSSTIWSMITRRKSAGDPAANLGQPVSCIFPGHPSNEEEQIRRILAATAADGVFVEYSSNNELEELHRLAAKIDNPNIAIITVGSRFFEPMRDSGRDLMLDGIGGDEVLGGSSSYLADLVQNGHVVRAIGDLFRLCPSQGEGRFGLIFRKAIRPVWRRLLRIRRPTTSPEPPKWIHPSRIPAFRIATPDSVEPESYRHRTSILKSLRLQQNSAAQDGAEQLLASEGLERGSPLLDIDIVEFALKLPPRAFSNGRQYKHLLRGVAYDSFPESVRSWVNPYPSFYLEPHELDTVKALQPPSSWVLVDQNVVYLEGLYALFESAKSDRDASSEFGRLTVTEAVLRKLVCQQ